MKQKVAKKAHRLKKSRSGRSSLAQNDAAQRDTSKQADAEVQKQREQVAVLADVMAEAAGDLSKTLRVVAALTRDGFVNHEAITNTLIIKESEENSLMTLRRTRMRFSNLSSLLKDASFPAHVQE